MPAKGAPVGQKQPSQSRLDGISGNGASKIDGSAVRAMRGGKPDSGADHKLLSASSAPLAAGSARLADVVE